jgi:hypothetical protein
MRTALIAAIITSFVACNLAYAQSAVPPTKNVQVAQTPQGGTAGGQSKGTTGATTGAATGGTLSAPMIVGLAVAAGVVAVAASNSKSTTSH